MEAVLASKHTQPGQSPTHGSGDHIHGMHFFQIAFLQSAFIQCSCWGCSSSLYKNHWWPTCAGVSSKLQDWTHAWLRFPLVEWHLWLRTFEGQLLKHAGDVYLSRTVFCSHVGSSAYIQIRRYLVSALIPTLWGYICVLHVFWHIPADSFKTCTPQAWAICCLAILLSSCLLRYPRVPQRSAWWRYCQTVGSKRFSVHVLLCI